MKKFLIFFGVVGSLSSSFLYTSEFINEAKTNIDYIKKLRIINNLESDEKIEYNNFIVPKTTVNGEETVMYYGRVLKYFFANSVEISNEVLENLKNQFSKKSESISALSIQNLLASTINLSIYGSSSDAEFFAESFAKWLDTPDELKNKSWEITNNFFTNILPELLKTGAILKDQDTNAEKTIVNLVSNNISTIKYNINLEVKDSNPVDLKYQTTDLIFSQSYWKGSSNYNGALNYIAKQTNNQSVLETFEIIKTWINDNYTRASEASIQKFNDFNKNNFKNFDELDKELVKYSIDNEGVSRLPFKKVYDNLEENYLISIPSYFNDSEKWTTTDTKNLKQLTLFLYNILSSLIENEIWVRNLLTGFIISPDYPLIGASNGTMGYTSTAGYTNRATGKYASTTYSYIVLTGVSLTIKEFNSNYKMGFWSSPIKYNVLIHEYGHAIDAFGSRLNENRNTNYSNDISYKEMYSGNIFGDYKQTSTSNSYSVKTWVIIVLGVIGSSILIIGISYTVNIIRSKKKKV
ncbi:hypothetical protein [Spiroplasma taiwanense]|uniref:Transmembrane protein n=1 Tax=Spiroplasma taiwanense CT-1 TaxID=1276220 RepID=S5LZL4_9MOLU|nr:hypothetical protein [Spiroplasma taiwanense]AGR41152.1 hypothetical protein STAIW_v1c05230 [Spiroplasma taiwanense CT-1]